MTLKESLSPSSYFFFPYILCNPRVQKPFKEIARKIPCLRRKRFLQNIKHNSYIHWCKSMFVCKKYSHSRLASFLFFFKSTVKKFSCDHEESLYRVIMCTIWIGNECEVIRETATKIRNVTFKNGSFILFWAFIDIFTNANYLSKFGLIEKCHS